MSITNSWLQEVRLSDILESKDSGDLVRVYPGTTLDDACRVMAKNHILSTPVFDLKSNLYVGFFDVLELVKYVCDEVKRFQMTPVYTTNSNSSGSNGIATAAPPSMVTPNWNFSSAIIRDVLRKSKRCTQIAILADHTGLWDTVTQLRMKYQGQHRVLVQRGGGSSDYQLISGSDIIRFLDKNRDKLVDVVHMQVDQMPLHHIASPVISMNAYERAVDGFYKMACHNLDAVAIVEETSGKLVGHLSASDLRGITAESFHLLYLPVNQFLHNVQAKKPMATCQVTASINDIISKVVQHQVDHVWVIGPDERPLAIITLTDILYSLFRVLQLQS